MKINSDPYDRSQVSSKTINLTPYRIYLEQVKGISDNIRATSAGVSYYPLQFGGLKGQRQAEYGVNVVDVMTFQSKGDS